MLANFMSACCCYIGLVVGLVLGFATHAVKYIWSIAAGMFLYISLVNMVSLFCCSSHGFVSSFWAVSYLTISCRGLCLNYLKKYLKRGGLVSVAFYNKLSWFVSELPEKDISKVVV